MQPVSYERQTLENPNPLARFAHRRRIGNAIRIVDLHLPRGGTFVDFGAGTGMLLGTIGVMRPDATCFGVEPFMQPIHAPAAAFIPDLKPLRGRGIDLISAFEVCEHMHEHEIETFLDDARWALSAQGRLVVSVPIMYGAAVLPKVANRMLLWGLRRSDYRLGEVGRSMVGIPIPRPPDPRHTHAGFDFRWLRRLILKGFALDETFCSPIPSLPWFLNSQAFFICRRRPAQASA